MARQLHPRFADLRACPHCGSICEHQMEFRGNRWEVAPYTDTHAPKRDRYAYTVQKVIKGPFGRAEQIDVHCIDYSHACTSSWPLCAGGAPVMPLAATVAFEGDVPDSCYVEVE